ncbi:unnamed protein product [Zymoseptoria tritici ST99CH_3D7]|uniref:Mitochondrial outer membrane protein n=2 Tax=Zymoseptoria tritici TaxID=1047171 RepID=F9X107_ZYMTI|nr:uncharacterized protein MYCGRDRAFT_89451 [Zymoseptoria tritici IPO323]EGP91302.1 hypothetical protein MYCGRDRAFT_89451 [Zymoseptoria tritici IPO323]SMQ45956.1 unnamed protein product [Zymoseptoria tritici ST99CH_3D7]
MEESNSQPATDRRVTPAAKKFSIFDVPAPLRELFTRFPLYTYDANELPLNAPTRRTEHSLHIFSTTDDAAKGRPSFNPSCLKWQAFLRFAGLPFRLVPSSNHASPSGALPFLQPALSSPESSPVPPIPSNKLKKWLAAQKLGQNIGEVEDIRYEAYASLLDNRLRKAWLYQLYLAPENSPLVHRLYVAPCSSQPFVQMSIAQQLRTAAEAELVKSAATNIVSAPDLIREADEAFESLSNLLGKERWFFGQDEPGLFDASVFAYTHLLLEERLGWRHNPLEEVLQRWPNLVWHRDRVVVRYFEG